MSNSLRLLKRLDELLDSPVELTLYGRAALELGFSNPKLEYSSFFESLFTLNFSQNKI